MKTILYVILICVASLSTVAQAQVTLKSLGANQGMIIGTAVKASHLQNAVDGGVYNSIVAQEYSSITAESEMKMSALQKTQGVFSFSSSDAIVDFAANNGQAVHGHALVWEVSTPAWFSALDKNQKLAEMQKHIRTVVNRYKNRNPGVVPTWDVVNESVTSGGTIRDNMFTVIGTSKSDYIFYAFKEANAADPSAVLFYNDFKFETPGAKQDGVYNLIRSLKIRGAPIHGIGIQGHMSTDNVPPSIATLQNTIRRFAGLGLKVMFTELDVRTNTSDGTSSTEASYQTAYYHNVVRACVLEPACVGVTTWGFTRRYSWIPNSFPGYSAILPFDSNYQKTGIYNTISNALK